MKQSGQVLEAVYAEERCLQRALPMHFQPEFPLFTKQQLSQEDSWVDFLWGTTVRLTLLRTAFDPP